MSKKAQIKQRYLDEKNPNEYFNETFNEFFVKNFWVKVSGNSPFLCNAP